LLRGLARFGEDFELDTRAYELRRAGQALKLERIPMEILLLLVEQRGRLVTREQIVERVWGKGIFLDADNSINGAIRKIRQVLGDQPDHPRFIHTITGRGYRFIAPVVAIESGQIDALAAAPPPPAPAPRRAWLVPSLVALGVLLLATATAVAFLRPHSHEARVMVAVLPFENLTGDAGQDYFSDGLTEEMITQLGNRDPDRLGVIARTSVMHFKGGAAPLDQIARELGVQYVLEGSVRRDARQVRVTAQLIRVGDQSQLWTRQYDRRPADVLTLQGEIAEAIAGEIQTSLGRPRDGDPGDPVPSAHGFEAYDLFLRGEYYLNRRTVPDIERAIRYYQQSTAADPEFARAFAALSDAYSLLAGYTSMPPQTLIANARAAALRALQLDSTLAEAHTAYALIVQNHDWDWATSGREFRRAIELNPNYATAHHWYAEHLMWLGRFGEAFEESERARQLDPLSLIIAADNGAIFYFSRQYDRAIAKWRSVLAIDPDFPRAHVIEMAYIERGMFDEALADVEQVRQRNLIADPIYWSVLASTYGRAGRRDEAQAALAKMLDATRTHPVQSGLIAAAYAGLGDKAQALTWLERAYQEHSNDITTLKVNPAWDLVRREPRFQRLLVQAGLAN
jgi:TolB-like protein/DNA-binding winged helix-turn-helix (wHTH) protein/Flp pilus assembly protein TadD